MNQAPTLQAPFPYFGGKRKVAEAVWERFGDVENYVEPFFGSGAVLLGRPHEPKTETVNDADGMVSNFWRALQAQPERVSHFADWPVNENDLHARHAWLVGQKEGLQAKLEGDPEFYDCKIAGWWVWGMCAWIGSGFCSGNGPWVVKDRKLVHLGDEGRGINRQRANLGNDGQGINRKLVHLGEGRGINRKRVHLGNDGQGINRKRAELPANGELLAYFQTLAARLRSVRVCCGDWSRVCGPSVTFKHGTTAVFLDPPYSRESGRDSRLYRMDCLKVAHDVRKWAIENGENPLMRIALCGYDGEHKMPAGWDCFYWNAGSGFGGQRDEGASQNGKKERIWFSPYCQRPKQELFNLA